MPFLYTKDAIKNRRPKKPVNHFNLLANGHLNMSSAFLNCLIEPIIQRTHVHVSTSRTDGSGIIRLNINFKEEIGEPRKLIHRTSSRTIAIKSILQEIGVGLPKKSRRLYPVRLEEGVLSIDVKEPEGAL